MLRSEFADFHTWRDSMTDQTKPPTDPVSRRRLFVGVSTVAAAAAATTLLPSLKVATPVVAENRPIPERGGGYQLTEHVKRYYQTTLV